MIHQSVRDYPVSLMCRVLGVSVSGYYDWRDRALSSRTRDDEVLAKHIGVIFHEERGRAGARRIRQRLRQEGLLVSRHRISRLLRLQGLKAKAARRFKATTNSCHGLPVAPNVLGQDFRAVKPNEKWVSDITYVWTDEGWLYVATVMDCYSRQIVGWSMQSRMTTQLVMDALQMAIWRRKMPHGVVIHSDQGRQYCSQAYQQLLSTHGFICSMSKRGDCYDNAAMEGWNHSFKVEAIHGEKLKTRVEAEKHIFGYIEIYYNRKRLHSSLGYLSPVQFEEQRVA